MPSLRVRHSPGADSLTLAPVRQMMTSRPYEAASAAGGSRRFQTAILVAMVLAGAIALSPNNVDPDLWGHVQYAEDALVDGRLHRTATHTYTAADHRWINHENLSELALALGYRYLGARGLLIAKTLLGLAVLGLMIRAAMRRGVSLPVVCGFLLLVAAALTSFWAMRPQLSSFVLLALMVVLLEQAFRDWHDGQRVDYRWLLPLPLLFAVWANSHGAFVAGVCLLLAYLGARSLQALLRNRKDAAPTVLRLTCVGIVCAAATLLNPYGIELHAWLLESLRHPRPEISEWAAPKPSDAFFFPFVLLSVVGLAAWFGSRRRRDWTHGVLLALCLWQAASHSRHIALFAILAGFWIPVHLESLLRRLRQTKHTGDSPPEAIPAITERDPTTTSSRARWLLAAGLAGVFALLAFKLAWRLGDFPVEKESYPVGAVQFMAENDLSGRLVVAFNWAQYAIAALAPDVQVAFDGRFRTCYPQEVIDMHFDFLLGDIPGARYRTTPGPVDPTRVLHYGKPDLVLVDRRFAHSAGVMEEQQDDFVLLYQDALAQVWGRRSVYDAPSSPRYLASARRSITDRAPEGSVTWPALPERTKFRPVAQHADARPQAAKKHSDFHNGEEAS